MLKIKALNPVIAICILTATANTVKARQLQTNKPVGPTTITPAVNLLPPAPTGNVNYVRSWEATGPITNPLVLANAGYQDVKQTTQYVDGLGRPLQTVIKQLTPQQKDMVAPIVYDKLGREAVKYLPYVSTELNGLFKIDPFNAQKTFMQGQYSDDQVYYAQTEYDASPLNRVTKTMTPGNSWGGSSRGINLAYLSNTAGDAVRIWYINNTLLPYNPNDKDVTTNIPYNPATPIYPDGELYKNVATDENGHSIIEFKDKNGQIVLRKVESGDIPLPPTGLPADLVLPNPTNPSPVTGAFVASNSITLDAGFESGMPFSAEIMGVVNNPAYDGYLSTYYVYDDFNSLRFVIPPKAVAQLLANNWQLTTDIINELCFRFEYDERRRMIAKKMPGADWVYMIYDVRDRPVFMQDGNMRLKGQWMATLYDGLSRTVMTGMMTGYTGNAASLQNDVTAITGSGGESTVDGMRINKYAVPLGTSFTALTKTRYDNYQWTNKSFIASYNAYVDAGTNAHPVALPLQEHKQTTGLETGTQVKELTDPNNLASGNWLTTVNYYDDHNRLIQTNSETQKGTDITTIRYNFTDKVICTYLDHTNPTGTPASVHVKTNIEYDHAGLLLEVWKTINDDADNKSLIVKNEYDELGQLNNKQLGHKKDQNNKHTAPRYDPLETLKYAYNIRGSMTGINKDYANGAGAVNGVTPWFGMELNYDRGFQHNQYNGNIAGTKWRSRGDDAQRSFGYSYDKSSRIMGADFAQYDGSNYIDNSTFAFDMQMGDGVNPAKAYDPNGNIKAMKQWGLKLGHSSIIDELDYTYYNEGNKLAAVTDNAKDAGGTVGGSWGLGDFTDNNKSAPDYGYDVNGNLIADLNKKMIGVPGVDKANGAITYNHLNLPWKVQIDGGNKGTITYTYDATGVKLQKDVLEIGVNIKHNNIDYTTNVTTTTSYVGGVVYESKSWLDPALSSKNYTGKMQFIGHEEGRIRYVPVEDNVAAHYEFDFFVKDHLGNVRMVLSEEYKNSTYQAGMEPAIRTFEVALFGDKVNTTATPKSDLNNNAFEPTAENQWVSKLNGSTEAGRVGPGVILKVMSGDKIKAFTRAWYEGTADNSAPVGLLPIITNLLAQLTPGVANIAHGTTTGQVTNGILQPGMESLLNNQTPLPNAPKAYLNWVLLDEQEFKMAAGNAIPVPVITNTQSVLLDAGGEIEMTRNGYLYVYVSNESKTDVYFDDLRVEHIRGALMEETHYYPFGLAMAGISSRALNITENKKKFNGIEYENAFDINIGEAFYRTHDPQLGRWWQIDPKIGESLSISPYATMDNNPVLKTDPMGDIAVVDDAIIGFFKGLFRKKKNFEGGAKTRLGNALRSAGRHAANSAKIYGGLVATDKARSILGQIGQVLSRLTWQLPNTIAGFLGAHGTNMLGDIAKVSYYGGATVLQQNVGHKLWGGITLGSYIIGDRSIRADPNNELFQHEYGHYLQSEKVGVRYLFKFGIPSLINAKNSKTDAEHANFRTEKDASTRAYNYFLDKAKGFYHWYFETNPVDSDPNQMLKKIPAEK